MRLVWPAITLLGVAIAGAQTNDELRSTEPRTITFEVIDNDGAPVADASVGHDSVHPFLGLSTDSAGRLTLKTRAPAFVVRKLGYRSQLVRAGDETDLTLTLQREALEPPIAACPPERDCATLSGLDASFCFQAPKGVKAKPQKNGVDSGFRRYVLSGTRRRARIQHSGGHIYGLPLYFDVWRSVEYHEVVHSRAKPALTELGTVVRDARGTTSEGKHWRSLGTFGEVASYRDVSAAQAQLLDQMLDSVCLLAR